MNVDVDNDIDNALYKGIYKYFTSLSSLGFINNSTPKKMLVACFLRDLLQEDFGVIPTEQESYFILNKYKDLTECTCSLPFIKHYNEYSINTNSKNDLKIFNDNSLQINEDGALSVIN